jgi:hypothetical protein
MINKLIFIRVGLIFLIVIPTIVNYIRGNSLELILGRNLIDVIAILALYNSFDGFIVRLSKEDNK